MCLQDRECRRWWSIYNCKNACAAAALYVEFRGRLIIEWSYGVLDCILSTVVRDVVYWPPASLETDTINRPNVWHRSRPVRVVCQNNESLQESSLRVRVTFVDWIGFTDWLVGCIYWVGRIAVSHLHVPCGQCCPVFQNACITSAKEVMFSPVSVCLSLSVC